MRTEKNKGYSSRHKDRNEHLHHHAPLPERGKNVGGQDERRHGGNKEHHEKN